MRCTQRHFRQVGGIPGVPIDWFASGTPVYLRLGRSEAEQAADLISYFTFRRFRTRGISSVVLMISEFHISAISGRTLRILISCCTLPGRGNPSQKSKATFARPGQRLGRSFRKKYSLFVHIRSRLRHNFL
jgi:hypothetical protein